MNKKLVYQEPACNLLTFDVADVVLASVFSDGEFGNDNIEHAPGGWGG
ncbi:MAG: hypothetical protein IKB30_03985 [Clostridia bacterium]|nr:hypothetical protein [Clostridia bacterium]